MADLLTGLNWQAGPATTLSIAGGKARATATSGGTNPRIYKGPFNVVNGQTYTFSGHAYMGTASGGSIYTRVSDNSGVTAAGSYNQPWSVDTDLTGLTFTAGYTGLAYFGIVPLTPNTGEYGEVTDTFQILDGGPTHGVLGIADGDDTSSGTSTLKLTSNTSYTELNDTSVGTSGVLITANAPCQELGDQLLASLALPNGFGGMDYTEADDTFSSTSTIQLITYGTGAPIEGDDTLASTNTLKITGAVSSIEQNDTLFDIAGVKIVGTYVKTEGNDTIIAKGGRPPWRPSNTTSSRPYRLS